MTAPDGLQVISNGVPGARERAGGWTTWHWAESSPMATYLSTVVIGHYDVTTSRHDGKPMVVAVPSGRPVTADARAALARTGEIADFLASRFGPYPFDAYGGAEWLYRERFENEPVATSFAREYDAYGPSWGASAGAPGDPTRQRMFDAAVYVRGGMTLYALRRTIGDADFDRLLTTWTARHRGGNVTTADFAALAESVSGKELDAFFQSWLFTLQRPPRP